jgi:SpoVK/Ycf46/Vps4 family AAA+-type ATPase
MQNNNESVKRILLTFNTIIDDLINKGTINDLVIVATTNVKDSIDPAVLRRFYFEENFDIKVEKAGFCEYIEKLNDIVEVFQKNDERILSGLYEVYSEKKFTLGEIKRIISRYYMKLKIENDGNREEICEYFEKQKSFSEIIQEQIKQKEE